MQAALRAQLAAGASCAVQLMRLCCPYYLNIAARVNGLRYCCAVANHSKLFMSKVSLLLSVSALRLPAPTHPAPSHICRRRARPPLPLPWTWAPPSWAPSS